MSTETMGRLPNTVTRCHEMIRKLQDGAGSSEDIAALNAEIEEKNDEIKSLSETIDEHEKRIEELEKIVEGRADPIAAIDGFLDECERIGPQRYEVPLSDRAQRAIVVLHDAAGRNP
jgi:chromosome segregation ATPase